MLSSQPVWRLDNSLWPGHRRRDSNGAEGTLRCWPTIDSHPYLWHQIPSRLPLTRLVLIVDEGQDRLNRREGGIGTAVVNGNIENELVELFPIVVGRVMLSCNTVRGPRGFGGVAAVGVMSWGRSSNWAILRREMS